MYTQEISLLYSCISLTSVCLVLSSLNSVKSLLFYV